MKNRFILGAISGMGALTLAVPILAQLSSAQTDIVTSSASTKIFTQENVQDIIARDDIILAHIDEFLPIVKSAIQAHRDALTSAAAITDDAERATAVRAAHDALHTTIKAAIDANPELKAAMPLMKFGKGHHGHGPRPEMLAEKLGMTAEELKAAIDSGKTLEEIAAEKGIELPVKGAFMMRMHLPEMETQPETDSE